MFELKLLFNEAAAHSSTDKKPSSICLLLLWLAHLIHACRIMAFDKVSAIFCTWSLLCHVSFYNNWYWQVLLNRLCLVKMYLMGSWFPLCPRVMSSWTLRIDFRLRLYWSPGLSWLAFSSTKRSLRGVRLIGNEAILRPIGCKPPYPEWEAGDHFVNNEQAFNSKPRESERRKRGRSLTEIGREKQRGKLMTEV